MTQKKKIRVRTNGPLSLDHRHTVPWEDIWIEWKGRPGRPRKGELVTVISLPDLDRDIAISKHILAKGKEDQEMLDAIRQELIDQENIRQMCLTNPDGIQLDAYDNVQTREAEINRRVAEDMLAAYLRIKHQILNPKFCWQSLRRRPFVMPM